MVGITLGAEVPEQLDTDIGWLMLTRSLCQQGWTCVDLDRFENNQQAVDMQHWAEENCAGKYHSLGRHWIFEHSEDAVLFRLKWS